MRSFLAIVIYLIWPLVLRAENDLKEINQFRLQSYEAHLSANRIFKNESDRKDVCKNPALNYLKGNKDISDCTFLSNWIHSFKSDSIQLGFAAAYGSNPASTFGHIFLLFDSKTRPRYLQLFVNFAAEVEDDVGTFKYIFGGLGGGFLGNYSIGPFYAKVEEYSNFENRDVWLYRLNLSTEEVYFAKLLLFELLQEKFKYYFISRNCAYELVKFFEIVRPSIQYEKDPFYSSPMTSAKKITDHIGLVDTILVKSLKSQYLEAKKIVPAVEMKRLLQENEEKKYEAASTELLQARILRNEYFMRKLAPEKRVVDKELILLTASRSFEPIQEEKFISSRSDSKKPLNSHLEQKLTLSRDGSDIFEIKLSGYSHLLLDRPDGYNRGQQIELFTFSKKLSSKVNYIDIAIVDIYSISSFADPDWPISFKLNLTVSPEIQSEFGLGIGYDIKGFLFYMLPKAEMHNRNFYAVNEVGLIWDVTKHWGLQIIRNHNFNTNSLSYLKKVQLNHKNFSLFLGLNYLGESETSTMGISAYFD